MREMLRLGDVGVRIEGNRVLDGIDWTVRAGERWAVLGPNGAGKTTLLRLAATQLFPSSGSVEVLGARLGRVDVWRLRPHIGLVSQALAARIPPRAAALDVVLTARYGYLQRWHEAYSPAEEARAAALLGRLGCGALAGRGFASLSEGERKRVEIARGLFPEPELLLLDEPAAGLDLGAREELVGWLGSVAHDGAAPTTVMVTHHVEEIPPGFTHALLLRRGSVVAAGPLDSALTAEQLSACYGIPLHLERRGHRYWARGVLAPQGGGRGSPRGGRAVRKLT